MLTPLEREVVAAALSVWLADSANDRERAYFDLGWPDEPEKAERLWRLQQERRATAERLRAELEQAA